MKRMGTIKCSMATLVVAGMLAAAPAFAEKPSWKDGDRGARNEQADQNQGRSKHRNKHASDDRDRRDHERQRYFNDQHRTAVHQYYAEEFRGGRCPPGLRKKHNGCLPPGQAKKWRIGQPLPRGVIYYNLPPTVVTQIGPPPSGHKYVRVASDILLMAIGTGMIVDAIDDLSRQ